MRQIGTIEQPDLASRFGDYLASQGISCAVEQGSTGYTVWIHEEDQIAKAKEELALFQRDPGHQRYQGIEGKAKVVRQQRVQQAKSIRSRTIDLRDRWSRPAIDSGPVTFALMSLMVIVAILTGVDPCIIRSSIRRWSSPWVIWKRFGQVNCGGSFHRSCCISE